MAFRKALLPTLLAFCFAYPAHAEDRLRPGLWLDITKFPNSTIFLTECVLPAEAAAMNGDAVTVERYLQSGVKNKCHYADIIVAGNRIDWTVSCGTFKSYTETTLYMGDTFQRSDALGRSTSSKLVGTC